MNRLRAERGVEQHHQHKSKYHSLRCLRVVALLVRARDRLMADGVEHRPRRERQAPRQQAARDRDRSCAKDGGDRFDDSEAIPAATAAKRL